MNYVYADIYIKNPKNNKIKDTVAALQSFLLSYLSFLAVSAPM